MARTQRIFSVQRDNRRVYAIFPLIPGLFEFFFSNYRRAEKEEKENAKLYAKLFEEYYHKSFIAEMGASTLQPTRIIIDQKVIDRLIIKGKEKIIPLNEEISNEVKHDILPFEHMKMFLSTVNKIALMDCACRVHMRVINNGVPLTNHPINV